MVRFFGRIRIWILQSQNRFCVSLPKFKNGFWIHWVHPEEEFKESNPNSDSWDLWSGTFLWETERIQKEYVCNMHVRKNTAAILWRLISEENMILVRKVMRSDCFEGHVYRSYTKNAIRYIYIHSFKYFQPEDKRSACHYSHAGAYTKYYSLHH